MTVEEIKELIQLVQESGVAELEVQRGENRVRIRRSMAAQDFMVPAATVPLAAPAVSAAAPVQTASSAEAVPAPNDAATDEDTVFVKSPIVGTYYDAPAPGSDPFVKVGDRVSTGQVLCIIESMKLMNEIEAELAGTILRKLVENGKPVEYGETLFAIRPS